MKRIVLAIDIGNTNITIGLFEGIRLSKKIYIPTDAKGQEVFSAIKKQFGSFDIETAIISSVVPRASRVITSAVRKQLKIKAFLLGRDIIVPMRNLYRRPEQVGQDRLANAYACLKLYGAPAIIVDFGTATTFDYIDSKGSYSGGIITPGVKISLDALAARTALLPKIELKKPKRLIGKDTVESMRSGVLYGLSAMCDGVISRMVKEEYPRRVAVVATGGLADFFTPLCKKIGLIDKDLTLKGLLYIYNACNSSVFGRIPE